MKFPKIDASILCFLLVIAAAIPVTSLRARTYSIGYELGSLKQQERLLRQRNNTLQSDLASVQRKIRDAYLGDKKSHKLILPDMKSVMHEN